MGFGCVQNKEKANELFLKSAELGSTSAMVKVGYHMFKGRDPQRWVWLCKAARKGRIDGFLHGLRCFQDYTFHCGYVIGKAAKDDGCFDFKQKKVFGTYRSDIEELSDMAIRAIAIFDRQCIGARKAVETWCLVAIQYHVVKDIRRLVGEMIWESRLEIEYRKL